MVRLWRLQSTVEREKITTINTEQELAVGKSCTTSGLLGPSRYFDRLSPFSPPRDCSSLIRRRLSKVAASLVSCFLQFGSRAHLIGLDVMECHCWLPVRRSPAPSGSKTTSGHESKAPRNSLIVLNFVGKYPHPNHPIRIGWRFTASDLVDDIHAFNNATKHGVLPV